MKNYIISGFADEIHPDMKEQYAILKQLGINNIELRGVNGRNISELTASQVTKLKDELDSEKMSISAIGSPVGKIKITDDFEKHFEEYKKIVEFAKILETKYIRMFSFYVEDKPSAKDEVYKRLDKMIDYAIKENVVLCHENEKKIYGDTEESCLELMQKFYCNNFKTVFDFANFVQCGCDTLKAYSLLEPYVEYFHIKDATIESGEVVPVGTGDGNVKTILDLAFQKGYSGYLSLEPHLTKFIGLDKLETEKITGKKLENGADAFALSYQNLVKILS